MFVHDKRLQYTVRVAAPDPGLANLLLEQFGGPQGELAAAMRYFTQGLGECDPGRKDLLMDIATEELSHLEIIGSIVGMLNKGAKGRLAEAVEEEAELYRSLTGGGNDSHITSLLYGGGPALVNSGGVPWSAAYIDTIGEPTADLRSNIAAEARATCEDRLRTTDQPHRRSRHQGCADLPHDPRTGAPAFLRKGPALDPAELPARQAARDAGVRPALPEHVARRGRHARFLERG